MNIRLRIVLKAILLAFTIVGCSHEQPTIGVQPLEDFNKALTDTIALSLEKTYGFKVIILKSVLIPKETFVNTKTPRYRADSLLKFLKLKKPDTISYVLGLIDKDISVTKRDLFGNIKEPHTKYSDWGVFGLGYQPGSSSIVSSYRLQNSSNKLFNERMRKVSIHELGHNLGLGHCKSSLCVMQDAAETIETVDKVKAELCIQCRKKIL